MFFSRTKLFPTDSSVFFLKQIICVSKRTSVTGPKNLLFITLNNLSLTIHQIIRYRAINCQLCSTLQEQVQERQVTQILLAVETIIYNGQQVWLMTVVGSGQTMGSVRGSCVYWLSIIYVELCSLCFALFLSVFFSISTVTSYLYIRITKYYISLYPYPLYHRLNPLTMVLTL